MTRDMSNLANILRKKDTNIIINNSDLQNRGIDIVASIKNAMNQAKNEEYMINKDLKVVDTFV